MRTDQNNIHKVGMVNHTSPQELCRVLAKETNNAIAIQQRAGTRSHSHPARHVAIQQKDFHSPEFDR